MDDTNSVSLSSSWTFNCFYSERGSSAFYLYTVLDMIKIFKKINKYTRFGINILVRILLGVVYFILLFPFVIFIKLFTDFLEIKSKSPSWILQGRVTDISKFLHRQ